MKNLLTIVAIAGLLMTGPVAMAANPTLMGTPGDFIPDLRINGMNAILDTDGQALNAFVLKSLGGHFLPLQLFETVTLPFPPFDEVEQPFKFPAGPVTQNITDAGNPNGTFMVAESEERSSLIITGYDNGLGAPNDFLFGQIPLGQLYETLPGAGTFADISNDLNFTYNLFGQGGTFDGNLILDVGGTGPGIIGLSAAVSDTVIRGGQGSLGLTVDNTAVSGENDLNYTVSASALGGTVFGSADPAPGALGPDAAAVAHTVSAQTDGTTPLGANVVTLTVDDPNADPTQATIEATLTVLGPAATAASFDVGGTMLSIDFGDQFLGSSPTLSFGITAAAGADQAGLDLSAFAELAKFPTNATGGFSNQAAGTTSLFEVGLDTSEVGSFSGQYMLALSDFGGFDGATGAMLILDVTGNVLIPEPSSIVLLVMGVAGLWMTRRRRRTA